MVNASKQRQCKFANRIYFCDRQFETVENEGNETNKKLAIQRLQQRTRIYMYINSIIAIEAQSITICQKQWRERKHCI